MEAQFEAGTLVGPSVKTFPHETRGRLEDNVETCTHNNFAILNAGPSILINIARANAAVLPGSYCTRVPLEV